MKKGLLLLLAGLMAFCGVTVKAMADARVDSMSLDVREVDDIDLIWLYPNMLTDYKNTADFRLFDGPQAGGLPPAGTEWGGLIQDMSDMGMGTLGVYVGRPTTLPTVAAGLFTTAEPLLINRYWGGVDSELGLALSPQPTVDLFWANDIGGANLGIHVGYADALGVPATTNGEDQVFNLQAGLGFANVGSFSQGNIYAEYDNLGGYKAGTYSDIKAGTLWESPLSTDNDLRLSGDLELDSAPANASALGALLGISCDHKVSGGKALIVSGLFIDYGNSNNGAAVTNTSWSWVWNGGVEAQAFDWLTVRAGIEHVLYNRETANTAVTSPVSAGSSFNTGFTVNWQNWALDGLVTAASLEDSISNVEPGRGLIYALGALGSDNIVTVTEADLRYKF